METKKYEIAMLKAGITLGVVSAIPAFLMGKFILSPLGLLNWAGLTTLELTLWVFGIQFIIGTFAGAIGQGIIESRK